MPGDGESSNSTETRVDVWMCESVAVSRRRFTCPSIILYAYSSTPTRVCIIIIYAHTCGTRVHDVYYAWNRYLTNVLLVRARTLQCTSISITMYEPRSMHKMHTVHIYTAY